MSWPYWSLQVGEQEAGAENGWLGGAVEGLEGAGTAGDACLPASLPFKGQLQIKF